MAQYSIKDIEEITGVKAHTIRIWEKRYNIVEPKRTDTNIRYYTDTDLKRLLSISTLNNNGIKISHLAMMSQAQINDKILELANKSDCSIIETLKLAMVEFDEGLFTSVLTKTIEKEGVEKAITETVYPFFEMVGMLWLSGAVNPAQEHFVSNLIRQKLYKLLEETPNGNRKKTLVFLLEGEWHELGILFYSLILKLNGHHVISLGQSCPVNDVSTTIDQIKPNYALTAIISNEGLDGQVKDLKALAEAHRDTHFLVSGATAEDVNFEKLPKNTTKATRLNAIKLL